MRNDIENPSAYEAAIARNIKANARKTREANFQRDHDELYQQLQEIWFPKWAPCCDSMDIDREDYDHECRSCGEQGGTKGWQRDGSHLDLEHFTAKEHQQLNRGLGWLRDGYDEYGSLTENQAAKAKEIISEARAKVSKWDAAEAERLASAQAWEAGRQEFPCKVHSLNLKEVPSYSYYGPDKAWKMIVQREDGSRLYCTAPSKLLDAVFAKADSEWDEDKVGRAARGTELVLRVNVELADEATFAFGKRPHIVEVKDA